MSSQFLLLSPRQGAAVAAAEYSDFIRATGLPESELVQRMLDAPDSEIGDLDGFAGIFVGGSSLNMSNPTWDAWHERVVDKLTWLVNNSPVPCFFVCFGAGLLAQSCGGKVGRTSPEQSSETVIELTEAAASDPIFSRFPSRFSGLTGHTENVVELPAGATLLATGPTCPVQAYRLGDSVWATQFHAEMDPFGMETRMGFYMNNGYFDPEDFDAVVAQLSGTNTEFSQGLLREFVAECRRQLADEVHSGVTPSPGL